MNRYESEYDYFNTKLRIVFESTNEEVVKKLNHEFDYYANKLQYMLNYYDHKSDVHKLNTQKKIEIDNDNIELLDIVILSERYKKFTNNYFNIDNKFPLIDSVFINDSTISIINEIDLGAIAKGYYLDYCSKILKEYNEKVFINFGGSILSYWDDLHVGLKNVHHLDEILLVVHLNKTETLHTSATYEQKLPNNLSHIYQPIRHYEANHLKSVSVIDTNSSRCDALSTAIFAMETPLGIEFCTKNEIDAIIVDNDKVYISKNIINKISDIEGNIHVITY